MNEYTLRIKKKNNNKKSERKSQSTRNYAKCKNIFFHVFRPDAEMLNITFYIIGNYLDVYFHFHFMYKNGYQ